MRFLSVGLAAMAVTGCASVQSPNPALTTANQVSSATKFTKYSSGLVEAAGPTMRADGQTWLVKATRAQTGGWGYRVELASDAQDVSQFKHATTSSGAELSVAAMGKAGTSCRAYALNCRVDQMVAVKLDGVDMASMAQNGLSFTVKGDAGAVNANAPGYYLQGMMDALASYDARN